MADMTLLELSDLVCKWENILAAIVVIILGILAGIGKNKNVRLLGFAVTASGLAASLSQTGTILRTLIDNGSLTEEIYFNNTYNNAIVAAGLASFIIGTLGRVLIWLYAHKEYGTKIMWCIIVTVSPVIATFLQIVLRNALMPDSYEYVQVQGAFYAANSVGIIVSVAINIIFMNIFRKNSDKEKAVPSYWLFHLLLALVIIITYLMQIGSLHFYGSDSADSYRLFTNIIGFFIVLVNPALALYLFIRQTKRIEE